MKNIKDKIKDIKLKTCPIEVLFYIATGRQCYKDVNPWYERIKNKSINLDRHNSIMHSAVIGAMFPELTPAIEDFNKKLQAQQHNHLSIEYLKKVEKQIIEKFNLPSNYDLLNINQEQENRIQKNMSSIIHKMSTDSIKKIQYPALQVLANATLSNVKDNNALQYSNFFIFIEDGIKMGRAHLLQAKADFEKEGHTFPPINNMENFFDLQDKDVIDEKGNINDYNSFINSKFVKEVYIPKESSDEIFEKKDFSKEVKNIIEKDKQRKQLRTNEKTI